MKLIIFLCLVAPFAQIGLAEDHSGGGGTSRPAANVNSEIPNQAYLDQCVTEGKNRPSSFDQQTSPPKEGEEQKAKGAALYKEVLAILSKPDHRCVKCHVPGKAEGSKNFSNILDRSELLTKNLINLEKPEESSLHLQLKDDSMPLDGTPLDASEKGKILDWIRAGAPDENGVGANELPFGFVKESDKYLCMLKDLRTLPSEEQASTRYLSLTHLYNAGLSRDDAQVAIDRLLNSLSLAKKVTLSRKVDTAGTLLRINLKDFGWTDTQWNQILARNPYGVKLNLEAAKDCYSRTKTDAPTSVPDIRGDWFVFSASKEPLYSELLDLPGRDGKTKGANKQFIDKFGGNQTKELHPEERFSVGNRKSGVSQNNRAFERVPVINSETKKPDGYVYISHDFKSSDGKQNIFNNPKTFVENGGEYIASIPKEDAKGNKMVAQVYGLYDDKGKAVPEVDANLGIVSHPARYHQAFRIANGVSCFDCHETLGSGIINPLKNDLNKHLVNNKDLFESDPTSPESYEKLLADYKPQSDIGSIYQKDQEAYGKFLQATGGKPGVVFHVANAFDEQMSERQVAAELGLPIEKFREEIKKDKELRKKLAFDSAGFVSRRTFLNEFKEAVAKLNFPLLELPKPPEQHAPKQVKQETKPKLPKEHSRKQASGRPSQSRPLPRPLSWANGEWIFTYPGVGAYGDYSFFEDGTGRERHKPGTDFEWTQTGDTITFYFYGSDFDHTGKIEGNKISGKTTSGGITKGTWTATRLSKSPKGVSSRKSEKETSHTQSYGSNSEEFQPRIRDRFTDDRNADIYDYVIQTKEYRNATPLQRKWMLESAGYRDDVY